MITEEQLGNLTLLQSDGEFRLSRDSLLLAAFATLHGGDRVCDLGSGVGSLLLALGARQFQITLDGVELRASAAELCRENLARNGLTGHIVTGDLSRRHDALPWGGYDLVVSNPPYFSPERGKLSPDPARRLARGEEQTSLAQVCAAGGKLCKNGGKFALCLRPERLAEVFARLKEAGLEPKRLQLVQSGGGKAPNLTLLEAVRGGKPGLQVLPVLCER